MSDKLKWNRAEALAVAAELVAHLAPVAKKVEIAGSLRRAKEIVGDIEILYIPKFEDRRFDMVTVAPMNVAEEAIRGLMNRGDISRRPSKSGFCAWGPKNKLALHRTGIPVDFFSTTEECWFNYLVCRTGPSESNIEICNAAIARGWKWHPYGSGFSRPAQPGHDERL